MSTVLYVRCFGLGNAVMAVPAVRHLLDLGHEVDVLVGNSADDFGASDVFLCLRDFLRDPKLHVFINELPSRRHDYVVLAMPYDGRWGDGTGLAEHVIGGLPRPLDALGGTAAPGPSSYLVWKKHESEYQLDDARAVTLSSAASERSFMRRPARTRHQSIYLGIGHKRDDVSLGKHWGNERYAELILELLRLRPELEIRTTGGPNDLVKTIVPIKAILGKDLQYRLRWLSAELRPSFSLLSQTWMYVGNDTGMMHVASSFDMPSFVLFGYPGLSTKNPPTAAGSRCLEFWRDDIDPKLLALDVVQTLDG